MAGRPFPEQDIGLVRADLHRFDVTLRDAGGGRWQAVGYPLAPTRSQRLAILSEAP
jgi:hypothetical protein